MVFTSLNPGALLIKESPDARDGELRALEAKRRAAVLKREAGRPKLRVGATPLPTAARRLCPAASGHKAKYFRAPDTCLKSVLGDSTCS